MYFTGAVFSQDGRFIFQSGQGSERRVPDGMALTGSTGVLPPLADQYDESQNRE
jgi:hypothetical protein